MSLIPSPYDPEWTAVNQGVYNDGPGGGGYGNAGGSIADPTVAPPLPAPPPPGYQNPCASSTIPITSVAGSTGSPLLVANPRRNLLILQNNSFAAVPGDTPPVLWFSFGRPAVVGQCQGLAAATVPFGIGEGIVLDVVVPRDSLYIAFGPSSGLSVIILGSVTEGIYQLEGNYRADQPGASMGSQLR